MAGFDLNIDNYKKSELLEMFELPEEYHPSIVEKKERTLREKVLQNNEINQHTRERTLHFLSKVKDLLINDFNKTKLAIEEIYNTNYSLQPSYVKEVDDDFVIQQRKHTPFVESYPSAYFPGIINPLKQKVSTQVLNIDTKFRDNYNTTSASNFNIVLPLIVKNVMTMQLATFEAPTNFYTISDSSLNNFFSVQSSIHSTPTIVKIPAGNYTPTSIVSYLNSNTTFHTTLGLTCSLLDTNGNGIGQIDISGASSFVLNFETNIYGATDTVIPLYSKFGWMLGYRKELYSGGNSYISEGIADFTGTRYMYLVVDDYNNNVNNGFYGAFTNSVLSNNILAKISLAGSTTTGTGYLNQNNLAIVASQRDYRGPVDLRNLNIQLLDEYGNNIHLTNMDYSFSLQLVTAYDI